MDRWDRCILVSMADLRDDILQIWWRLLHGPGCGTSRVGLTRWSLHIKEMDVLQVDDDVGIDAADFMQHIWYQTSWTTCCRRYGDYFMDLDIAYMEVDSRSSWCCDRSLRNDWWWHEDFHSYDLSVTVGLITRLVRVMGASSVQRCVSIMLEYHGSSSHDDDTWWGRHDMLQ